MTAPNENLRFWPRLGGSFGVTLLRTFCALISNKLFAVFLGPSLFACTGQLQNILSIGQATSTLALQNGWVSLTSRYKENRETLLGVWRTGYRLTVFGMLATIVLGIIFCFAFPLNVLFPGVPLRYAQAAILFALFGVAASDVVLITSSVMNGLGNFKRWGAITALTAVLQCLWVAFFLYTGMLSALSAIASQSILSAFAAVAVAKKGGFSFAMLKNRVAMGAKSWKNFALMGILPMLLAPLSLSIVRTTLASELGADAAGIWQGASRISDFFTVGISSVLGTVLLPAVAKETSKKNFKKTFFPILLKMECLAFLGIAVMLLFRHFIVRILFSSDFSAVADLLPLQLLGDFFRAGGFCAGLVLIAKERTKLFVALETIFALFFVLVSVLGIGTWGLFAPSLAYAIENFCYFVCALICVWRLPWKDL
ncbi:MAG: O-antigen translocase [Fibrobacteraceae bacterium]|nr:O-antigen translocase [Fibrobacteraceae bacterium]